MTFEEWADKNGIYLSDRGMYLVSWNAAIATQQAKIDTLNKDLMACSNENVSLTDQLATLALENKNLRSMLELCKIASCTCNVKSHEFEHHYAKCRYRVISEALATPSTDILKEHDLSIRNSVIDECYFATIKVTTYLDALEAIRELKG